jgi:hypothetical protein
VLFQQHSLELCSPAQPCISGQVIWQVPSIIGTGVAVSFVGVFLGPIYILIMHACTHALPKHLYGGAIGYIAR